MARRTSQRNTAPASAAPDLDALASRILDMPDHRDRQDAVEEFRSQYGADETAKLRGLVARKWTGRH
jgi:hypothetical protein